MEIEIDRRLFYDLLALLVLLTIAGLALLGRPYTPTPPRVIGWTDWTALKTEEQYRQELADLRADLAELAQLLQQEHPDPVRAEMTASRIAQRHAAGLGLLARQREAVVVAAEVVRDWAAGYVSYEDAVAAVNEAMAIIGQEPVEEEYTNGESPWGDISD
ncbi:MAG: hypothetical protein JXM73_22450 [Anaerolineae bacterium]|nr:hypothetical protein [Anaerolineae bacterium]